MKYGRHAITRSRVVQRSGKERRFYWYAHGSAAEVRGTLELPEGWAGWAVGTEQPLRILDRLIALLWGLTHDRPSARG
jgi:hypothetical protein